MTSRDELLQRVPEDLRGALVRALEAQPRHGTPAQVAMQEVLQGVGWPAHTAPIPLADELSPAQRAVAEVLAPEVGVSVAAWALPNAAWNRRRWLGQDPGGVLERVVTGRPLWRRFREAESGARGGLAELFASLPLAERLEAYVQLGLGAYRCRTGPDSLPWGSLDELDGSHGAWASRTADFLLGLLESGDGLLRGAAGRVVPDRIKELVLTALVRAGLPIAPRWDVLVPVVGEIEPILRALPEPRRTAALLAGFAGKLHSTVVQQCLALLPLFPSAELTRAALERARKVDAWPEQKLLAALDSLAEGQPAIEAELRTYRERLAAMPQLTCLRVLRPASPGELSELQRRQVERAGALLDGQELSAEARLDPGREEPAFAALEVWEIARDGALAYEAVLPDRDSGTIFRAGTREVVADRAQGGIECADADLREAFQELLRAPPKPAAKKPATRRKPPAKKSPAVRERPPRQRPPKKKPAASKKPAAKKKKKKKKPGS